MNFFQILFALCSGTAVFPRLLATHPGKVVLHLILIFLICTVGMTVIRSFAEKEVLTGTTDRFFDRTGSITVTPDKILLEKDPDETRSYTAGKLRFDYFAKSSDFTLTSVKESKALFRIFCFPCGAVFCIQDPSDPDLMKYRLLSFSSCQMWKILARGELSEDDLLQFSGQNANSCTHAEVYECIRKWLNGEGKRKNEKDGKRKMPPFVIQKDLMSLQIQIIYAFFLFFMYAFETLLVLLMSIVFFSLAQIFRAHACPRPIPFRALLITAVYASFPPLLAASILQAAGISYPPFHMIYFIAFLFYQIFAFNTVFRYFNPPADEGRNDPDF